MRGDAYRELGEQQNAIDDYSIVISLGGLKFNYVTEAEDIQLKQERQQRAFDNYNKAICLDSNNVRTIDAAYIRRGDSYHAFGQDEKAIMDYSEATGKNPELARVFAEQRWQQTQVELTTAAQ